MITGKANSLISSSDFKLYSYVLHYNPYTQLWTAILRGEDYNKYFMGKCTNCLSDKNFSNLIHKIIKL